MKCTIHGNEMEYMGDNGFGEDVWYCDDCNAEEEYEFQRITEPDIEDYMDDDPPELIAYDEAADKCGAGPGGCDLIGTPYCEFECPFGNDIEVG